MDKLKEYFTLDHQPQLIIVVNRSIVELQKISDLITSQFNLPFVCVNRDLSKILLSKPNVNYSRDIVTWFSTITNDIQRDPIVIQEIELLFEPIMDLDPLTLFRQASRNKKFLILWPGEFKNNKLSYATPEHAHYRNWADPGIEIIHV